MFHGYRTSYKYTTEDRRYIKTTDQHMAFLFSHLFSNTRDPLPASPSEFNIQSFLLLLLVSDL